MKMAESEGKYKVLVFPAGEVNSVELYDALCCAYDVRLYGASSVDRHGVYILGSFFEEIAVLTVGDCKADYINPDQAIFIDNSFHERLQVSEKLGIPVFDVDQTELLLDWKF